MNKNIQILDCTLRDGGLGLEDNFKNELSITKFSKQDIADISNSLAKSNLDIVELGSIEITNDDRTGFCIYPDIETISKQMPMKSNNNQLFAALYRGPDTPIEDIPDWNPNLCEAIRVIIRYSELQKSLDFCAALSSKGYKVFVQPMLTLRYTDEELQLLIKESNKMNAYALYFVDSYGYMQEEDIKRLFDVYDRGLNSNIKIGFHAHNNINLAFSNALSFINISSNREIIVDSCIIGMGQGAGNLQTEIITGYLNKLKNKYDYSKILDTCEIIEKYSNEGMWGYSVTRFLPALYKTAYKYSIILRNKYKLPYKEINNILANMPNDLRQRYTPENTIKLLKLNGLEDRLV